MNKKITTIVFGLVAFAMSAFAIPTIISIPDGGGTELNVPKISVTNLDVHGEFNADNVMKNPASSTNWTWTSDGESITLRSYSGPSEVIVPNILDGLPVRLIYGNTFFNNTIITSVTGGDFVTRIGGFAFYGCSSLVNFDLKNIEIIDGEAFFGCISLESIKLPFVTNIEADAFNTCSNLTSVTFGMNAPPETNEFSFLYVYRFSDNVTNYITNPTATGWGTNWNERPVVRLPLYGPGTVTQSTYYAGTTTYVSNGLVYIGTNSFSGGGGDEGLNAYVIVSNTVTLEAGTPAYVSNTVDGTTNYLTFGIPSGSNGVVTSQSIIDAGGFTNISTVVSSTVIPSASTVTVTKAMINSWPFGEARLTPTETTYITFDMSTFATNDAAVCAISITTTNAVNLDTNTIDGVTEWMANFTNSLTEPNDGTFRKVSGKTKVRVR